MGTTRSVTSEQLRKDDDDDDVAPPSQHSASGSAELSSDSLPTYALSFKSKIALAIESGIAIISVPPLPSHIAFKCWHSRVAVRAYGTEYNPSKTSGGVNDEAAVTCLDL